ncbi:DUF3969 family protein [Proteus hauseri]|uniref:DUF3969 family protein n=1 Tax=Proteus cibi TaxID=2050966 RepID=UPI0003C5BB49|nr:MULTISPECIES: DUF3969 family protein [Proteus]EST57329.1 hypothetical protein K151_2731 [Proteus hauseri ZMd44]MBG6030528.1 DUF3969 family protein [Proteus hauseri]MBS6210374.1 DUF3969 family protein [Proteus hauseri]
MKFCYNIDEKYANKFISFLALGVLTALEKKLISVDEAEGYIFKPSLVNLLKEINATDELINIINLGCELEDIESLIPEKLPSNIQDLLNKTLSVIKQTDDFGRLVDKEIKVL